MHCRRCTAALPAGRRGASPATLAFLAGSRQPWCQAAGMGKMSLRQGRKQISISYRTGCKLRHGELSGKTMAPSSLSSRSHQAVLGDAEAQPVKSPQLCQPSSPCPGPASGWWCGRLLPPHHAPEMDVAATVGPARPRNRSMGLQGSSQLSARQTDGWTAQDEPPPSAELGHIPCTRGIKPPGRLHSPRCPRAGWGQSGVRVGSWVPSTAR